MLLSSYCANVRNANQVTPVICLETLVVEILFRLVEAESLEVVESLELQEELATMSDFKTCQK